MDILKTLLNDDEIIMEYTIVGEYRPFYAISDGSDDISSCLEYTLHCLIDNGYEDDLYAIMGAFKPTEEDDLFDREGYSYISVDLGYIIDGEMLYWQNAQ